MFCLETVINVFEENVDDDKIEKVTNPTKKTKFTEREVDLKILRMKTIMEKEKELRDIQIKHEEKMNVIKETHLKEINNLELRAYAAKAKLAELLLAKEEGAHKLNKENMPL